MKKRIITLIILSAIGVAQETTPASQARLRGVRPSEVDLASQAFLLGEELALVEAQKGIESGAKAAEKLSDKVIDKLGLTEKEKILAKKFLSIGVGIGKILAKEIISEGSKEIQRSIGVNQR